MDSMRQVERRREEGRRREEEKEEGEERECTLWAPSFPRKKETTCLCPKWTA
jgi:hypothetical protein